jgi:hypothetical protein
MWKQFPPNLSCLQKNLPENNMEDLAGTCSTLFSGGLFWDQFLLDLRSFFGAHFRSKQQLTATALATAFVTATAQRQDAKRLHRGVGSKSRCSVLKTMLLFGRRD